MVWHCNEISTKGGEDRARRLLLFPSRVLTRSGSADPELTVSARAFTLGTPTRKIPLRRGANGCKLLVND